MHFLGSAVGAICPGDGQGAFPGEDLPLRQLPGLFGQVVIGGVVDRYRLGCGNTGRDQAQLVQFCGAVRVRRFPVRFDFPLVVHLPGDSGCRIEKPGSRQIHLFQGSLGLKRSE